MPHEALLTQDELDFLQTLHQSTSPNQREVSSSLMLKGMWQLRELLTRLAADEHITIQAKVADQHIHFPLHLVEDEFHAQHLQLGAPSIFEDGPVSRPWRLMLTNPIALQNSRGRAGHLWITELSFNTALVDMRSENAPPRQFAQWFRPEGYDPIAVRGTLERRTEAGLYAYRLSQRDAGSAEQLRQYLLQQYRLAHPALHA